MQHLTNIFGLRLFTQSCNKAKYYVVRCYQHFGNGRFSSRYFEVEWDVLNNLGMILCLKVRYAKITLMSFDYILQQNLGFLFK